MCIGKNKTISRYFNRHCSFWQNYCLGLGDERKSRRRVLWCSTRRRTGTRWREWWRYLTSAALDKSADSVIWRRRRQQQQHSFFLQRKQGRTDKDEAFFSTRTLLPASAMIRPRRCWCSSAVEHVAFSLLRECRITLERFKGLYAVGP